MAACGKRKCDLRPGADTCLRRLVGQVAGSLGDAFALTTSMAVYSRIVCIHKCKWGEGIDIIGRI